MPDSDFVPQASPLSQYLAQQAAIDTAIRRVLHRGSYILGEEVASFEHEFAVFVGVQHGVGVASGTDAIEIALRASGIGPGDEVITSTHTAVATVAAIERAGAVPVLVDIQPDSFLLDPEQAEHAVTPRTRAIVPVHLYGQPADLASLEQVARRHNLIIMEDCAQAHGARYEGKRVGSCGNVGCFSFYPTKNLGALGDGGMLVTDNEEIARRARALREYGWHEKFRSEEPGANSRLDELQAAVLRIKLPCLEADNEKRGALARRYSAALAAFVAVPQIQAARTHVFHQYVIRTDQRDALQQHLRANGIGTTIHYPVPVHLQPAYVNRLGKKAAFPVAERAVAEILSLPLFPELTTAQCDRIIHAVQDFFRQPKRSPGANPA
jgi:dTDP-4-amino-4,6-dideoxygalactose transaminase